MFASDSRQKKKNAAAVIDWPRCEHYPHPVEHEPGLDHSEATMMTRRISCLGAVAILTYLCAPSGCSSSTDGAGTAPVNGSTGTSSTTGWHGRQLGDHRLRFLRQLENATTPALVATARRRAAAPVAAEPLASASTGAGGQRLIERHELHQRAGEDRRTVHDRLQHRLRLQRNRNQDLHVHAAASTRRVRVPNRLRTWEQPPRRTAPAPTA